MREARPEETGVVFKSMVMSMLSTAEGGQSSSDAVHMAPALSKVSMTSKGRDLPESDDIKTLVDGLKRLDEVFQQKVERSMGIVERLAAGQQSLAQNVVEVEKLKYLTLHSIQLPAKPTPASKYVQQLRIVPLAVPRQSFI